MLCHKRIKAPVQSIFTYGICEEVVRKSQVNFARFIKSAKVRLRNRYVEATQVVAYLVQSASSKYRNNRTRARTQPGQRDLGWAVANLLGNVYYHA
jgi:hypothetical protein